MYPKSRGTRGPGRRSALGHPAPCSIPITTIGVWGFRLPGTFASLNRREQPASSTRLFSSSVRPWAPFRRDRLASTLVRLLACVLLPSVWAFLPSVSSLPVAANCLARERFAKRARSRGRPLLGTRLGRATNTPRACCSEVQRPLCLADRPVSMAGRSPTTTSD